MCGAISPHNSLLSLSCFTFSTFVLGQYFYFVFPSGQTKSSVSSLSLSLSDDETTKNRKKKSKQMKTAGNTENL